MRISGSQPASRWVAHFLAGVAPGGRVLDVACGGGRHLRLAIARGHCVTGIDRDLSGVADLAERPGIELLARDLEDGRPFPLVGAKFAGVIVTNYLWRPTLPDIVGCVAADGVLIYETFAAGGEGLRQPSNPHFLLRPGELITAVSPHLVTICFEHATLSDPTRVVQRIAAVGREHGWVASPPASLALLA